MTNVDTRQSTPPASALIKCVVWDLDHTLWKGVLLEDQEVTLHPNIHAIVQELDRRGILQSIASRNDYEQAMAKLRAYHLDQYFLYPQINWGSKAQALQTIAQSLNIGLDSLAFIDDQPFERDEVHFSCPQVLCLPATSIDTLLDLPALTPPTMTEDASKRRFMYLSEMRRQQAEEAFTGSKEAFLASLRMVMTIAPASAQDLQRAEELTLRTHQLNTTGYTYTLEELDCFRTSPRHQLLLASLEDIYGSYGTIGLALLECQEQSWTIKLLLMSCRVLNRGVGTVLLHFIMRQAREHQVQLYAEFVPNGRNRMMYLTYKFAGFREVASLDMPVILKCDLDHIQTFPEYLELRTSHELPEWT
jgi:FkbH-like protein